jgi:hypothetical protein
MPTIIITAIFITTVFAAGYGTGLSVMTKQVAVLDAQIELINRESKYLLVEATEKVEASEKKADLVNANLEIEHDKNIKSISDHATTLESARRVWLNNQTRSNCTLPKADNPSINKNADETGYWLDSGAISSRVDGLIQKADTLSADHHEVIQFLNSIPRELIK